MDEKSPLLPAMAEQKPSSSIYKPLDSENFEIRLLLIPFSIIRSLGQEDPAPLSGKLIRHHLPLGDGPVPGKLLQAITRPMYYALSYVWGDITHREEIIIDGKPFSITRSLYTALRQLQSDAFGEECVWVDAICINQDDDVEKSAQIRLMREVYRNAAIVRVWLGSGYGEEDEIYKCFNFIAKLTNAPTPEIYTEEREWWNEKALPLVLRPLGFVAQATLSTVNKATMFTDTFKGGSSDKEAQLWSDSERMSYVSEYRGWKPKPKDLAKANKTLSDDDYSGITRSMEKILIHESEWFSRIWVVQEVGVANENIEVCRGSYSMNWEDLLNTIFYLHYECKIPFPSIDKITGLETIRAAFRKGKRRRLRDLMYECRYRHATNPRDKIYGLYGLMGDQINEFIKPDYSKSVEETYAHTTLHFVTQIQSLNPICGQQIVGRRQGLPSWVPDLGLDLALAPAPLIPPDGVDSIFNASGYDERSKYILPDPSLSLIEWSILPTQGICIGTVSLLSQSADKEDSFGKIQTEWRKTLNQQLASTASDIDKSFNPSLDEVGEIIEQYSAYFTASTVTSSKPQNEPPPLPPRTNPTSSISNYSEKYTISTTELQKPPPPLPPRSKSTTSLSKPGPKDIMNPIVLAYLETLLTGRLTPNKRASLPYIKRIRTGHEFSQTPTELIFKNNIHADETTHAFIAKICKALEAGMGRRRFIITGDGNMGAGPEHTEVGDLVVVLLGCSVPVILRKVEKKDDYIFVGECYVNGFMDAEAIAWVMRGKYKAQDFVLV